MIIFQLLDSTKKICSWTKRGLLQYSFRLEGLTSRELLIRIISLGWAQSFLYQINTRGADLKSPKNIQRTMNVYLLDALSIRMQLR